MCLCELWLKSFEIIRLKVVHKSFGYGAKLGRVLQTGWFTTIKGQNVIPIFSSQVHGLASEMLHTKLLSC